MTGIFIISGTRFGLVVTSGKFTSDIGLSKLSPLPSTGAQQPIIDRSPIYSISIAEAGRVVHFLF
jgi:hypothetical protein